MIIKYSPEDGEPKEFEFIPSKLISPEAEAIENVGGNAWDSFEEFGFKFLKGNIRAYRAALWVMMKRSNPRLRFQDLVFKVGEVEVDYSKTELTKLREALEEGDESVSEQDRAYALSQVEDALESKESESVEKDLKEHTENSEVVSLTSVPKD